MMLFRLAALMIFFSLVMARPSYADEYSECVNRLINSNPKPLSAADKRLLIVAITSNCNEKKKPVAKLENACERYLFKSKRKEGAAAILASFSRCGSLSKMMENPPKEGKSCSTKICQNSDGQEVCVPKPGYFDVATEEYCSKWVPMSRCVSDSLQFNEAKPIYVLWQSGEKFGRFNCSDV